eukprot:m.288593 g.288593  ORF g.288593 m.288593 type:complete len:78 (+) comp15805_c0_seq6:579-812(+)
MTHCPHATLASKSFRSKDQVESQVNAANTSKLALKVGKASIVRSTNFYVGACFGTCCCGLWLSWKKVGSFNTWHEVS